MLNIAGFYPGSLLLVRYWSSRDMASFNALCSGEDVAGHAERKTRGANIEVDR
jgi:hypothetical protein